jgi:peptidoglycan/xylan/chitin deacetylase (PgdA/CDA1 family)
MLNFRTANILFAIVMLLLGGANFFLQIPWYAYAIVLILWVSLLFYGSYFINSQFYLKAICRAETNKKEIAISFDDGPDASTTESLLAILDNEKVEATFFCIGKNIEGNENLLQKIHAVGHLIGNHSFSHAPLFDLFSTQKMLADMKSMDSMVEKTIGLKPKFFRPPYGVTNPNLKRAIQSGQYLTIGWSIRSLDTVIRDENKLRSRITQVKPGDIILFHDRSKAMLSILPEYIQTLKGQGFQIIRLDKLLNLDAYV